MGKLSNHDLLEAVRQEAYDEGKADQRNMLYNEYFEINTEGLEGVVSDIQCCEFNEDLCGHIVPLEIVDRLYDEVNKRDKDLINFLCYETAYRHPEGHFDRVDDAERRMNRGSWTIYKIVTVAMLVGIALLF